MNLFKTKQKYINENYKQKNNSKQNLIKLKPGSGRLLFHPARKRIGPFYQLPGLARGKSHNALLPMGVDQGPA